MKLKLAALLTFIVIGLAGCSAADDTTSKTNANAPAANSNSAPPTVAQNNPNTVEASATATETTGGTKEGCKCSAAGMSCNHKEGEKGCCGGKDGSCSTMKNGASKCCASADKCCSVAKSASASATDKQSMDKKAMPAPAEATKKS